MEIKAPKTETHSFFDKASLNKNTENKALRTITPPDTRGNCTEAGTSFAASNKKKFPPYAAPPNIVKVNRGLS